MPHQWVLGLCRGAEEQAFMSERADKLELIILLDIFIPFSNVCIV